MNELRLFAEFKEPPSEQDKQAVRVEIQSLLRELSPGIELSEKSGSGSWWIVVGGAVLAVGGWVLLQACSWALKRGLDYLVAKPASEDDTALDVPPGDNARRVAMNEKVELLMFGRARMEEFAIKTSARQVVLGEWSDTANSGVLMLLRKSEHETVFAIIETDSKSDFDARLSPRQ